MKLSDQKIKEFQELYKQKFGEELDHGTASFMANRLVGMMKLVYKPIRKKEFNRFHS